MKQNRKTALALMLAAMLLTLSGCTGVEDGTIDYVDGHWVFTEAQTGQSMDMTQSLTDPAALAAIWPTLTTQEQLTALSGLSNEEYEALRALLDGEAQPEQTPEPTSEPTPELTPGLTPEPADIQPVAEPTPVPQEAAPSPSPDAAQTGLALPADPAALAEIWFTLSPQEQMSAIAALTAEQFIALRELTAGQPRPTPAEEDVLFIPSPKPTEKHTPAPTIAPTNPPFEDEAETAEPENEAETTEPEDEIETTEPEDEIQMTEPEDEIETTEPEDEAETTEPEDEAETTEPEDEIETTEPEDEAEMTEPEDEIETTEPEDEIETTEPEDEIETTEPDLTDMTDLAGIWHTLSPQEQLTMLSSLTIEQYVVLQERLARPSNTDGDTPNEALPSEEAPAEQPDEPDKTDGDTSTPEEEISVEESEESDPIDLSYLVSIWHTLTPGKQISILSALPTDQYHALQRLLARQLNGRDGMPKDAEPAEEEASAEQVPAEQSAEPVEEVTDLSETEIRITDGLL